MSLHSPSTPRCLGDVAELRDLEYDQRTYMGRVLYFTSMTDPRTLFTTERQLREAESLLQRVRHRSSGWESISVASYLHARRRVQATLHPDTNRPIPLPFRFSAFVPSNFVTLACMLHPSQQTPWRAMLWQWVNQTYNAGFNYCNAGGASALPMRELLLGYTVACTTACGLAFSLNRWAARRPFAPSFVRLLIPYTAVAGANIANVCVMRLPDWTVGIPLRDVSSGEVLANGACSPTAGRAAVLQVAISRVLIPVPLMIFPPLVMEALFAEGKGVSYFVRRRAKLYAPVNVAVIVAVLCGALPLCIAVFPQEATMKASRLEERFHGLRNSRGEEVTLVQFNKGL